jgi:hypothetical protein
LRTGVDVVATFVQAIVSCTLVIGNGLHVPTSPFLLPYADENAKVVQTLDEKEQAFYGSILGIKKEGAFDAPNVVCTKQ